MRVRFSSRGFRRSKVLFLACTIALTGCEPTPSAHWVLLSEDSEGRPTYIDTETIRLRDEGVAIYKRVVGDPSSADRVDFVQGLDCVNLRWAFFTLDESRVDSIASTDLSSEEWATLALNPANRVLLDEVCEDHSPARWIRVLNMDSEEPGELREVWVDRESIVGPSQDSVRTEIEDLGFSTEIFRSWSRWVDASPDSGYLMIQADVACNLGTVRYQESSRYSSEGELVRQVETTDFWFYMYLNPFEEQVFSVVCQMPVFFDPEPTPQTSPGGG